MRPFIVSKLDHTKIDFERIGRLRAKMMRHDASLCSERALFYTQSFKQTEHQPMILRKAQAFALTLSKMTQYIEEDSLIFGNQASRNFAAPIFPEYSIDWIVNEIDSFPLRNGDAFAVDPKRIFFQSPEIGKARHIRIKSWPILAKTSCWLRNKALFIWAVSR